MVLISTEKGKGGWQTIPATVPKRPHSSVSPNFPISHSSSASDSDSGASSNSGSDSEEITQEYLDTLLEKARTNIRETKRWRDEETRLTNSEEDVIQIGAVNDEIARTKLPDLNPGTLPEPYFTLGGSRQESSTSIRDIDTERVEKVASSLAVPAPPAPPPETSKSGKLLTKKERKDIRKSTAGPDWFDLPAPDPADLPRLYREVEALRLRNALDPKRFYRKEEGEGKGIKGLPRHFAIGTIVPSSTPFGTASSDNLTRAERKRTIVDELVDDAEAKRYAKKKFEDLQGVRGARGRGTLAKKMASRKRKW